MAADHRNAHLDVSSLHLLPKFSILTPLSPVAKNAQIFASAGKQKTLVSMTGMFQERLKAVEDLPGPLTLSDTATVRPQTEITTAGRDYPCIKSPFKIKSLDIGAAHGKGSGCGRASWAHGAGLTECPEQ